MTRRGKQSNFCYDLMERINFAVAKHEVVRLAKEEDVRAFRYRSDGLQEIGGTKSQIQADIVRLRRELAALSKLFDETEE